MMETNDSRPVTNASRRALFTRAWRDAVAAAPRVAPAAVRPLLRHTDVPPDLGPNLAPDPDRPMIVTPSPVHESLTVDELLRMAAELGLADRSDSLSSLARSSLRLLPASSEVASGRSWLGESPLVQIDLRELSSLGISPGLPCDGVLQFHCDISGRGPRWHGPQDPGLQVLHVPEPEVTSGSSRFLQLSVELAIPRVWSAPVEALGLDDREKQSWQELRFRLADRQGVELFDGVDGYLAVHRFLGYPDERTGEMALLCELLASDAEVDDHPLAHPLAPELEPLAGRWRLLLQLSVADGLLWPWTRAYERLYFWIDEHDLETGDLSRVFAVAQ